jgi:anti-sigma-K factor RskA
VPINRQVKSIDPESVPADWSDPRPLWQRFHTLRTSLAVAAVAVNAAALAMH